MPYFSAIIAIENKLLGINNVTLQQCSNDIEVIFSNAKERNITNIPFIKNYPAMLIFFFFIFVVCRNGC